MSIRTQSCTSIRQSKRTRSRLLHLRRWRGGWPMARKTTKHRPTAAEIDPRFRPVLDAFAVPGRNQSQDDVFLRLEGEREDIRDVWPKTVRHQTSQGPRRCPCERWSEQEFRSRPWTSHEGVGRGCGRRARLAGTSKRSLCVREAWPRLSQLDALLAAPGRLRFRQNPRPRSRRLFHGGTLFL